MFLLVSDKIMDIKHYMPIKKLRRSYRTSLKDKEVCKVPFAQDEGQCSVLGYFELIPLELRFRVFQFLTG